jgi:hypothetical protein
MTVAYIFENSKGRKTYLSMRHDDAGNEIWSAFIGAKGGNMKNWKTYDRAKQEMEKKGCKKIGERVLTK